MISASLFISRARARLLLSHVDPAFCLPLSSALSYSVYRSSTPTAFDRRRTKYEIRRPRVPAVRIDSGSKPSNQEAKEEAMPGGSSSAPPGEVDVGDPGATLAGDGLAMAMGPLGHEPDASTNNGAAPSSGHEPAVGPEIEGASTAAKGGCLANVFLALAVVTFAANNSALIWAIEETGATTCNVLCAAQMIGIATFGPLFYKDLTWAKLRALRWRDWAAIVTASLMRNVLGAYFDVEGMRLTSVPTLAIVEMLEPVEFLFMASCLIPYERRSRWIVFNMGLLVVGVLAGLLLQPALNGGPLPSAKGVVYLMVGGFGYTVAEVIGHIFLEHIPLGIYGMARVVLGVAFYHLLAFAEGDGSDKFIGIRNLYSPEMWKQMAWYGLLFVTVGQWLWLTALRRCRPQVITLGTSSLFILNMVFSVIILGEPPTAAELVGGAIILVSIVSSLLEARDHERKEAAEKGGQGKDDEEGGEAEPEPAPGPLSRGKLSIARESSITSSRA